MTESFRTRTARLLRTQDNRITAHPVFVVQQRDRIYGIDVTDVNPDAIVWMDSAEGEEVAEPKASTLESEWNARGVEPSGYRRTATLDRWVFVQACFTEEAAQRYIDANRHNLTDPRVYVESAHRNREWIAVAALLARDPTRLFDAIRRFTFDAPGGKPNGPGEAASVRLFNAIGVADLPRACVAYVDMMRAWSEDCAELRAASEEMFPGEDFKGTLNPTLRRSVELGESLFSFHSKQHWVNKGRSWYATCGYREHELITLDVIGRVVRCGAQFTRAEEEGTYPITVYPIDPARGPDPDQIVAGTNKEIERRMNDAEIAVLVSKYGGTNESA